MTEEEKLIAYSLYNPVEYAQKAAQATKENKGLMVINNKLEFIKVEKSLDEKKEDKLLEINFIYEQKACAIKFNTPESEILTWDIQKMEAESYIKDNSSETPFIDGLAFARKMERIELINKILAKVAIFNSYMANLTGQRMFYEDRIKKATSSLEVSSIVWD